MNDNKDKMNTAKKSKKSQVQKKKNNSNLDWYYKNNFKKKNNNKNYKKNNNNKKNYNKNQNKQLIKKNNEVDQNKIDVKSMIKKENIKKDLNKNDKTIVFSAPKKNFWDKLNVFKKRTSEIKKQKIENVEDFDKTILVKKADFKEHKIIENEKNEHEDLDKTIIVKKSINNKEFDNTIDVQNIPRKKNNNNDKSNNVINDKNNNVIYNKTLYGTKKLNLNNDKIAKKSRKWIYLKESLLIALIFSIVNIVAYYLIDDIMIINISNLEFLNVVFTFIVGFIIIFLITFIIDSLVTEFSVKYNIKKQHKEGDSYRNRWFIKGKNKEDIKPKKRK